MKMKVLVLALTLVFTTIPSMGQQSTQMSKEQMLELQLISARLQLTENQADALKTQFGALVEQIKKEHPGYSINFMTMQLVKDAPPAPAPATKPAKK
jgi:gas vesicle protein